jgi:hypothetical protein
MSFPPPALKSAVFVPDQAKQRNNIVHSAFPCIKSQFYHGKGFLSSKSTINRKSEL